MITQKDIDRWRAYKELRSDPDYTWRDLYNYQKIHEPEKITKEEIEIYEKNDNN